MSTKLNNDRQHQAHQADANRRALLSVALGNWSVAAPVAAADHGRARSARPQAIEGDQRRSDMSHHAGVAAAIKMRLLTAQRGREVIKMRWRDLDLETGWWTIPGEFCKNGRAHRVPLVPDAITIIKAQLKNGDQQQKHTKQNRKGKEENDYVFVGGGASVRDRAKEAPSIIARVLKIEFRGHDLRRTAATKMAEAGVPRGHISAVLNHVQGGASITRVPATASLAQLVRLAHQRWAIEQHYQDFKSELGLDHFEGRTYPGWQHHMVISAVAYAFLQSERRRPRAGPRLTFPQVCAFVQEIFTGLFLISRPRYMHWMKQAEQRSLQLRI